MVFWIQESPVLHFLAHWAPNEPMWPHWTLLNHGTHCTLLGQRLPPRPAGSLGPHGTGPLCRFGPVIIVIILFVTSVRINCSMAKI